MGNSFELGNYTMKHVDLKSIEVIGGYYLKDKANVKPNNFLRLSGS